MKRLLILLFVFFFFAALPVNAAEVKNISSRQVGNRVQFTYDLTGDENEAEVNVALTVGGKSFQPSELHLEGDVGKVKPGRGKTIWWNVLQDFPRGLDQDIACEITAGGKTFKDAATGMEMIFVKGGCYQMGDTFGDGGKDEKPVHDVCVSDFYMGKHEVTQGQWKRIMGNNPSSFSSCGDNCPVENVSWNDVQNFIGKLNSRTGKRYRLPTEAEWEYAARSGGKSEKWSGTSSESSLGDYAWYISNSGRRTHPVGQKQPNGLGLHDMSGNVWEWCQDWYGSNYYGGSGRDNPVGPSSGSYRVIRGGGWSGSAASARAAFRSGYLPDDRYYDLGFRLALPPGQ